MKRMMGRFFFFIAVKTPIAAALVITIVIGILSVVIFQAQVSIYEKTEGRLTYKQGEYCIEVRLDNSLSASYPPGTKVIWYLQFEGKHLEGIVNREIQSEDRARTVIIKNVTEKLPSNLKTIGALDVTVELFSGKESIKERLLKTRRTT